jgi:hypothetical protein
VLLPMATWPACRTTRASYDKKDAIVVITLIFLLLFVCVYQVSSVARSTPRGPAAIVTVAEVRLIRKTCEAFVLQFLLV